MTVAHGTWTAKRGDSMDGSKKEPIPLHFDSAEAAGDFRDTHSAADYWDETEEVEKVTIF